MTTEPGPKRSDDHEFPFMELFNAEDLIENPGEPLVQTPSGAMKMWFTGEYREVDANERLAHTESMSDANGNVLAPSDMGMTEGHPTTTEVRVELENLGAGTRLVLTHAGISADSPGAAGWAMALDRLSAHIHRIDSDQN